jgi:Rha family phage regulatory protein
MNLTAAGNLDYALTTAPHWAGGFGHSNIPGAEVMRRQAHSFFYALRFMVGGVWGGCEACRTQGPVDQPDTSSAALSLVTPFGGLKLLPWSHPMNTHTQVTPEFRPELAIIDGQIKTTSVAIAKHFNKRHDNVIQAIEKLECSPEFASLNFKVSKYQVSGGKNASREETMYEITRDGFMFLAMGFTGKQAAQWKEAYILDFNRMENQLLGNSEPLTSAQHALPESKPMPAIRARVLIAIDGDTISKSIVPENACIVIPDNTDSLHTFINEMVPLQHIQLVFELASRRILMRHQAALKTSS